MQAVLLEVVTLVCEQVDEVVEEEDGSTRANCR